MVASCTRITLKHLSTEFEDAFCINGINGAFEFANFIAMRDKTLQLKVR